MSLRKELKTRKEQLSEYMQSSIGGIIWQLDSYPQVLCQSEQQL